MNKYLVYILILLIILIIIVLYKRNIETFDDNCDICKKLTDLYNKDGLLFRGLECDITDNDNNNLECIKNEIEGPREPCFKNTPPCKVASNQGATTFLKSGMNPFFYFDIGGTGNIVLIFDTSIVTKNSCGYNQDAGHNGCSGTSRPSKCDFNCYSKSALDQTGEKCNPTSEYICMIDNKNNDLLSRLETEYNNFMTSFVEGNTSNQPTGIQSVITNGCAIMKENQVSAFWDKSSSITNGSLLAIGILITEGSVNNTTKNYEEAYTTATIIQNLINTEYTKKIPIVKINRTVNKDVNPITGNNGQYYMAKFNDLEFITITKPNTQTKCPKPTCSYNCIDKPPVCSTDDYCKNWAVKNINCSETSVSSSYCNTNKICNIKIR